MKNLNHLATQLTALETRYANLNYALKQTGCRNQIAIGIEMTALANQITKLNREIDTVTAITTGAY